MPHRLLTALCLALASGSLFAEALPEQIEARLTEDMKYLADDDRQGRGVGLDGLNQAADYILKEFDEIGLKTEFMPLPNDRCCFWGGWGGSLAIIDTQNHLSYSYVMNKMNETTTGDPRGAGPLLATYAALAT